MKLRQAEFDEPVMDYRDFHIETFEVGRGLWHARFRRADQKPTLLDGLEFEYLDVGIAWPSIETALTDARKFIDSMNMNQRSASG